MTYTVILINRFLATLKTKRTFLIFHILDSESWKRNYFIMIMHTGNRFNCQLGTYKCVIWHIKA